MDGLDQYGAEPFEQQPFGTAGVEGVNRGNCTEMKRWAKSQHNDYKVTQLTINYNSTSV